MPKSYGQNSNFDPVLISSQILLIVGIFYSFFIFFTVIFSNVFGIKCHIDQILNSESFVLDSKYGIVAICSYFFTNLLMIAVYIFAIEKAQKILDYVLTNFFVLLVFTTLNSRFPNNLIWWVVNLIFLSVVTLVSEFLCLKIEQREIKLDYSEFSVAQA